MHLVLSLSILLCFQLTTAWRIDDGYTNPVIKGDTPDPGVIEHNGFFYAVTTSGDAADAFPIWKSSNLVHWKKVGHVFPSHSKPVWGVQDYWAPEIHKIAEGKFNVYFAARDSSGLLCVGVAAADSVEGPYKDIGEPLVRTVGMGNIDPTSFLDDDGKRYLLWKADGNAIGKPTPIFARLLNQHGLSFASGSQRKELITNTLPWEGAVTEAPWMVRWDDMYYLFYSGNGYAGPAYAVGVAKSQSALGPFEKRDDPILITGDRWTGPGHCSVIQVGSNSSCYYMIYHAWPPGSIPSVGRNMLIDELYWGGDWPFLLNGMPSNTSRPFPPV